MSYVHVYFNLVLESRRITISNYHEKFENMEGKTFPFFQDSYKILLAYNKYKN